MALEIVWTKRAQTGYDKIINYLEINFSGNEVQRFVRQSNEFFKLLSQYPELLESTKKAEVSTQRAYQQIHNFDLSDQAKK